MILETTLLLIVRWDREWHSVVEMLLTRRQLVLQVHLGHDVGKACGGGDANRLLEVRRTIDKVVRWEVAGWKTSLACQDGMRSC